MATPSHPSKSIRNRRLHVEVQPVRVDRDPRVRNIVSNDARTSETLPLPDRIAPGEATSSASSFYHSLHRPYVVPSSQTHREGGE